MRPVILFILIIFLLTACAPAQTSSPAVASTATLTILAPTLTLPSSATPLPTQTPAPPTVTPLPAISPFDGPEQIALSAQDPFYVSTISKEYGLVASGSLIGPQGYTYSAYLFFNYKLSSSRGGAEYSDEDALKIAFYRWDGTKNIFLSVHNFPSYQDQYATDAGLVNWDQPREIWQYAMIESVPEPEPETVKLLKQTYYSSDINQNGLPEFAFVTEYCVITCHTPEDGVHLFEIENPSTVKNITKSLPGLTFFEFYTVSPFTFAISDQRWFDVNRPMGTYWVYAPSANGFVDVSKNYADNYLALANDNIRELKAQYGTPFDANQRTMGIYALEILMLYEKAGKSEKGLQIFLEVTNIAHWQGTERLSKCWLQVSRATAQQDFSQKRLFTIPPGMLGLDINPSFAEPLKQAGYDTSACNPDKK